MSVVIHCSEFRIGKRKFKKLAQKILASKGITQEVEIVFVGKKEIKELNRRYLGKNRMTDVLAFPLSGEGFALPPRTSPLLGQVFICYPQAIAQARRYGHSKEEELSLLIIHGILHLLGFKDESKEEQEVMRAEEQRLLALIN